MCALRLHDNTSEKVLHNRIFRTQVMSIVAEIFNKIMLCKPTTLCSVKLYCAGTTGPALTALNWRGVWKKALSDSWSHVKFSFSLQVKSNLLGESCTLSDVFKGLFPCTPSIVPHVDLNEVNDYQVAKYHLIPPQSKNINVIFIRHCYKSLLTTKSSNISLLGKNRSRNGWSKLQTLGQKKKRYL